MSIEIVFSIVSGVVAIAAVLINWRKWRQEQRAYKRSLDELEDKKLVEIIHSEVSKESIAIRGAQEAVELMERMLAVAAASEAKLQEKVQRQAVQIQHLEEENELLKRKVSEQSRTIEKLQCRLETLEKAVNDG
jgi:predicted RNase H-like nuclease (RuvC/YqgF family)